MHVSTPTWANHVPLLSGSGLKLERYPYFDPATGGVQFGAMMAGAGAPAAARRGAAARLLPQPHRRGPVAGAVAGALALVKRRQLLPFIDMAYQGLGESDWTRTLSPSACSPRSCPRCCVAVSCSKNFGLYRERVGVAARRDRQHRGWGWRRSASWCAWRAACGPCRRITAPHRARASSPIRRCAQSWAGNWSACAHASRGCASQLVRAAARALPAARLRLHRYAARHVLVLRASRRAGAERCAPSTTST